FGGRVHWRRCAPEAYRGAPRARVGARDPTWQDRLRCRTIRPISRGQRPGDPITAAPDPHRGWFGAPFSAITASTDAPFAAPLEARLLAHDSRLAGARGTSGSRRARLGRERLGSPRGLSVVHRRGRHAAALAHARRQRDALPWLGDRPHV